MCKYSSSCLENSLVVLVLTFVFSFTFFYFSLFTFLNQCVYRHCKNLCEAFIWKRNVGISTSEDRKILNMYESVPIWFHITKHKKIKFFKPLARAISYYKCVKRLVAMPAISLGYAISPPINLTSTFCVLQYAVVVTRPGCLTT